jgi:uncharacterized membrane protein YbaN (DUF454 family)
MSTDLASSIPVVPTPVAGEAGVCPVTHARAGAPVSEASRRSASRPVRYAMVGLGVGCVGLGAVGVVVPGLPTTIFLIIASWCFARSCPWLEDRLIRNKLFAPFLKYLEPGASMPARAKAVAIAIMWVSIGLSAAISGAGAIMIGVLLGAGALGTWAILRFGRTASSID